MFFLWRHRGCLQKSSGNNSLEALISRGKIKQYTEDFSSPRVQWSLPPRRRIRARGGLRILEAKRPVLSRTEEDAAASTSFFQRRRRRRRRPTRRDRRHCGRKTESKKKTSQDFPLKKTCCHIKTQKSSCINYLFEVCPQYIISVINVYIPERKK